MIDYEALLKKYIEHVVDCEGTDFLSDSDTFPGMFSDEELATLKRVAGRAS